MFGAFTGGASGSAASATTGGGSVSAQGDTVGQGAGDIGGFIGLFTLPFKIGAANAKAAEAHYAQTMRRAAESAQAMDQMHIEQQNVMGLEQQKILSNLDIQTSQREAEAAAELSAAFAGVEGSTVDQVINQTETNEALTRAATFEQIDNQIQETYSRISGLGGKITGLTMEPFKSNAMKHMMNSVVLMSSAGTVLTGGKTSGYEILGGDAGGAKASGDKS